MTALPSERGASAILIALTMVFLLGAAALAIDISGSYRTARTEQASADLACLAGVQDLPADPAQAVLLAAGFARPNHDELRTIEPTNPTSISGNTRIWTSGTTTLEVETPTVYSGVLSNSVMRVSIVQQDATTFGQVLGADAITVRQEAYCGVFSALGAGIFPVGVGGTFAGGVVKFDDSDCNDEAATDSGSGVCNYLDIPRNSYDFGGTSGLIYNMMLGSDWPLTCYDPSGSNPACLTVKVDCDSVSGAPDEPCNQVVSKSGGVPNAVHAGLISGRSSTNHIGLLVYEDETIPSPANPHDEPEGGWFSFANPANPASFIKWNTNIITNPDLEHDADCVTGAEDLAYFDPFFDSGISPLNPTDNCEAGEVDDQPAYDSGSGDWTFEYVTPPEYEISRFDCRDRRLVVVPAGTWEAIGGAPSNERRFTITDFKLGYIVDPIFEDDSDDGVRSSVSPDNPDNRFVAWEHGGNPDWDESYANTSKVEQMSMLNITTPIVDGAPQLEVVGNCPLVPFPEPLADLLPKVISLVPNQ